MIRSDIPSIENLKAAAKRLRQTRNIAHPSSLTHSGALEAIAKQYGFRDWNTLSAAARVHENQREQNGAFDPKVGARISGYYKGHLFEGTIRRMKAGMDGFIDLTIDFDHAIDVVEFDSFSAFRKRVSCRVGRSGKTEERLSNGAPILAIETMHAG